MASSQSETTVRESSNTSLEDINGILDNIQDTIAKILHERGQLRRILQHFLIRRAARCSIYKNSC